MTTFIYKLIIIFVMNVKKTAKEIKKELKEFKKYMKKDKIKAVEKAKHILSMIKDITKEKDIKENKKSMKTFNKVSDGLNLYISSVTNLDKFNKKWNK